MQVLLQAPQVVAVPVRQRRSQLVAVAQVRALVDEARLRLVECRVFRRRSLQPGICRRIHVQAAAVAVAVAAQVAGQPDRT